MTAFDPTPLRPENAASPFFHAFEGPCTNPFRGCNIPAGTTSIEVSIGLTARQHAAIALCVPDSGTPWLDAIINRRRRDEMATAALAALLANPAKEDFKRGAKGVPIFTGYAYEYADAMLAASNKETK